RTRAYLEALASSQGIPDAFFAGLDHNDLDHFGATCRWGLQEKKAFLRRSLKVEPILRRFFSKEEMSEFHDVQSATGLLVSGSAGYQFFSREIYDTDLDTYCVLKECLIVGQWYMSIQYRFARREHQLSSFAEDFERVKNLQDNDGRGQTDYDDDSIVQVWDFQNDKGITIQLIAARHCAVDVVLSFHSTCVMNFISHRAAYSLFPRATFKDKVTVKLDNGKHNPSYEAGIQKYVSRGLRVIETPAISRMLDGRSDLAAVCPRFMDDSRSWFVPI
ncbi:hypothetical protein F5051DRAFT_299817, partial [Lentinula edodes]